MSLEAWLLDITGSFDKVRKGRYDEGSACGFVQECEEIKECFRRVCTPNREAYGGGVYDDCISYCNYDPKMQDIKEMFCQQPDNAWQLYNIKCEGFEGKAKAGYINIFGTHISILAIGSVFYFYLLSISS